MVQRSFRFQGVQNFLLIGIGDNIKKGELLICCECAAAPFLVQGPFQARQRFQGDGFELPGAQIGLKGGIDFFPEMAGFLLAQFYIPLQTIGQCRI